MQDMISIAKHVVFPWLGRDESPLDQLRCVLRVKWQKQSNLKKCAAVPLFDQQETLRNAIRISKIYNGKSHSHCLCCVEWIFFVVRAAISQTIFNFYLAFIFLCCIIKWKFHIEEEDEDMDVRLWFIALQKTRTRRGRYICIVFRLLDRLDNRCTTGVVWFIS